MQISLCDGVVKRFYVWISSTQIIIEYAFLMKEHLLAIVIDSMKIAEIKFIDCAKEQSENKA